MKKIFSISLYILASLFLIVGIYLTGLYLIINFLIGSTNMGQILGTMDSLPLLPLGTYSLILSGIIYILIGIIIIFITKKFKQKNLK